MEEYLDIINFCSSSSTSIWLRISFIMTSLYCLFRFSLFIWAFRFQIQPKPKPPANSNSPKKPNRKNKNKKKKEIPNPEAENVEPLLRVFKPLSYRKHFQRDVDVSADSLGRVIQGQLLDDTKEMLIVRELHPYSVLTLEEFVAQVSLLAQATHQNLTKLIGYSVEDDKPTNLARDGEPEALIYNKPRYLVYENVSGQGILENWLFETRKCLDWKMRMKIIVGVAQALNYLQNDMKMSTLRSYIHPANIWLDENFNPKLSAYGVGSLYYSPDSVGVIAERITKRIIVQADICGFGILLFEIVTGRRGRMVIEGEELEAFTDWAKPYLKHRDKLAEIADSKLQGKFNKEQMYEVCKIAEMCLKKQPGDRPCIADLVKRMEHLAE